MMTFETMIAVGALLLVAALAVGIVLALDLRTDQSRRQAAAMRAARDVEKKKNRKKNKGPSKLDRRLTEAGVAMSAGAWYAWVFLGAAFVSSLAFALIRSIPVAVIFAIAVFTACELVLTAKKRTRARSLDEQLARALPQIGQNLRAGTSIERSVRSVADNSPEPLATELRRVSAEAALTSDIASAFESFAERSGSKDVLMISTAMRITKTQGGSLADVLDNVSHVLESRQEIVRFAATQTASTKTAAIALIAITLLTALAQVFMQEGFLEFYAENPFGWVIIAVVAALDLIGYAAILKIADVKVE